MCPHLTFLFFLQLLKPAFVVIRDDANKTVLLIIRGTYSMKDTLTAVTGEGQFWLRGPHICPTFNAMHQKG